MTYFIHQSKRLAYLLRHSSLPDTQGWMLIADLIARHGFTHELLKEIIYNDEFGRYEFSGDRSAVKARYGHITVRRKRRSIKYSKGASSACNDSMYTFRRRKKKPSR